MKKHRVFDGAIGELRGGAGHYAGWNYPKRVSFRLAIRCLRILDGATLKGLGKDAIPFLAWGPNAKLAAIILKARKEKP
jgi:hypothetical protein